jgi:hypothetical protein
MNETMTCAAMLSELECLHAATGAGGITQVEIREATGWSDEEAMDVIHCLYARSKLIFVGRKRVGEIDGLTTWSPAYRIKRRKRSSTVLAV